MYLKKFTVLLSAFVLVFGIGASAKTLEFTMGSNTMYESADNIEAHSLENAPYTKNDRTMVPVRIISERFGADVGWDGEKNEVSITKGDKSIILTLGSDIAVVNGEEIKLDVSPEEFNGRTMVPLRFISETLEMDVKYIASTQQVIISNDEPLLTVDGIDITLENYKSIMLAGGYKPDTDDINEYVKEATEVFKLIYGAASKILAEGEYTLGTDSENVISTVNALKSSLVENNALTSTLAEYMDYQTVIATKAIYDAFEGTTTNTPDTEIINAAEALFNKYISEGADDVEITVHKTDEEIVKLFK